MQATKTLFALALVSLTATSGLAQRQLLQTAPAPGPACASTVAQTANDAGLTTLLAAAEAAGLSGLLSDPNLAYTVFAPTDEAFADAITLLNLTSADELLAAESLTPILENHLLAYPLASGDLLAYGSARTEYNAALVNITSSFVGNETVVQVSTPIAEANVILADVVACRSIVHVIDAVLIPDLNTASA